MEEQRIKIMRMIIEVYLSCAINQIIRRQFLKEYKIKIYEFLDPKQPIEKLDSNDSSNSDQFSEESNTNSYKEEVKVK